MSRSRQTRPPFSAWSLSRAAQWPGPVQLMFDPGWVGGPIPAPAATRTPNPRRWTVADRRARRFQQDGSRPTGSQTHHDDQRACFDDACFFEGGGLDDLSIFSQLLQGGAWSRSPPSRSHSSASTHHAISITHRALRRRFIRHVADRRISKRDSPRRPLNPPEAPDDLRVGEFVDHQPDTFVRARQVQRGLQPPASHRIRRW